eukprot:13992463-Alexandrium_andersonii.AAC.1
MHTDLVRFRWAEKSVKDRIARLKGNDKAVAEAAYAHLRAQASHGCLATAAAASRHFLEHPEES